MVEKNLILENLEIKYDGLFDVKGLLDKIDEFCAKRGYAKVEKERIEKVTDKGRSLFIELKPAKKTDHPFHTLIINFRISLDDIEEVIIKVDNVHRKIEKGKVKILMDAWDISDYNAKWEQTGWYLVLKTVYDRYIHKFIGKYSGIVGDDARFIYQNLSAYLELHRYMFDQKEINS